MKSDHQWEFLKDVAKLIVFIERNGHKATAGEMWRSKDQQALYYNGLSFEDGKLVNVKKKSKAVYSKHQDRLAVDINIFINGKLTYDFYEVKPIGDYWESLSPYNRWGGDFNKNDKKDGFIDTPHFERNV